MENSERGSCNSDNKGREDRAGQSEMGSRALQSDEAYSATARNDRDDGENPGIPVGSVTGEPGITAILEIIKRLRKKRPDLKIGLDVMEKATKQIEEHFSTLSIKLSLFACQLEHWANQSVEMAQRGAVVNDRESGVGVEEKH